MLVVDRSEEDLGRWESDVDGLPVIVDPHVLGLELGEIDSGDGLAVDDEEDAVSGEEVGQDGGGFGAFDDGVDRVDDCFQSREALDFLDDGGYGGVEGGGAAGDGGGNAGHDAGGGLAEEEDADGSEDEGQENEDEGSGASARVVLSRHAGSMLPRCLALEGYPPRYIQLKYSK